MTTFTYLILYLLGGLTFLPSIVLILLCYLYLTTSVHETGSAIHNVGERSLARPGDTKDAIKSGNDALPEQLRAREADVAGGYFAVCREYVPGGVNGKPPERTTPAGAVVAAESPSVYQSMYRSIFDRGKTQVPSIEGGKPNAKPVKRARNVFYIVLRHGHLMLYDDSEQLEVRHVISLELHDVDIYGGGDEIPEGELFIKRNCIRLKRFGVTGDDALVSKPFYFFSENASDKEDFYHAMLHNKERKPNAVNNPPRPLYFDQPDMIKLVRQLHTSEEDLQTRWLNAFIGRLFLSLYKTADLEDFVQMKITKKISRVQKPAFLSSIKLERTEMGDSAPTITNPKLRELTVNGDLTVEADVNYRGNFRLEIAAVARIELGTRFKPRQVNLILAGILKKLEGHILIRIKPPPSNRVWMTFESMPKMDMSIEPIVSSRQITYGIILRAIESRIREVIAETVVYPNWDDVPFTNTIDKQFRGGIWEDTSTGKDASKFQNTALEQSPVAQVDKESDSEEDAAAPILELGEQDRTMSMPNLSDSPPSELRFRKAATSNLRAEESLGEGRPPSRPTGPSSEKPISMRSHSFASAAPAVVNTSAATVDATKDKAKKSQQNAAAAMKDISSRSQPASPTESPVGSPPQPSYMAQAKKESFSSTSTKGSQDNAPAEDDTTNSRLDLPRQESEAASISGGNMSTTASSTNSRAFRSLHAARSLTATEKRAAINQSIGSATAAAKKWGWGVLNKHTDHPSQSETATHRLDPLGSPSQPIGRGQPLPPPGTPLPMPEKPSGWSSPLNIAKRKPVAALPVKVPPQSVTPPRKPSRPRTPSPKAPPLPTRHKRASPRAGDGMLTPDADKEGSDELMVVEAPEESQPPSPTVEAKSSFHQGNNGASTSSRGSSEVTRGQGWNGRLTRTEWTPERNDTTATDTESDMDSLRMLEATTGH